MARSTRPDDGPATRSRGPSMILLLALVAACQRDPIDARPAPPRTTADPTPSVDAAPPESTPTRPKATVRYADELAAVDERIKAHRARADATTGWPVLASLADDYLERARLTGDYDDYAAAEAALKEAFGRAVDGGGPLFTRAQLHFTLHRLAEASADLERLSKKVVIDDRERANLDGLRADIAFQRGDMPAALAGYEAALAAKRSSTALARMALYRWKLGDHEGADALYAEAYDAYDGDARQPAAWYKLVRGLLDLDRGRDREALAHYREAEAELAGYWLVEEHIAEILNRLGERDASIALYESLVERTHNPEFMDALADILREQGETARAEALVRDSRAAYERLLAQFPEAAAGHAIGHYLDRGDQPKRALELAIANHETRPNPDAKVLLARAHLAAGDPAAAEAVIREALRGPWDFADLHAVAAEVFAARGLADEAAAEKAKARAIDPSSVDE